MDNSQVAEKLFALVYQTFEAGHFDQFRATSGANNQRNEVQFRLQKNISKIKIASKSDLSGIADLVIADSNLSHMMGWMTDETHKQIEEILGTI